MTSEDIYAVRLLMASGALSSLVEFIDILVGEHVAALEAFVAEERDRLHAFLVARPGASLQPSPCTGRAIRESGLSR